MNIGIIGAGWFASEHAKALAQIAEVKLVAVCTPIQEAVASFAKQFGGQPYTDGLKLLNHPGLDAVLISTPHHLHTEYAIEAAKRGIHILLEKPMAPTAEECDQILAAAARAEVKLMVGLLSHFERPTVLAKEMLDSGELGEPVLGQSSLIKIWMEHNRRPWHLDRATGGGALLTVGIHGVDRLIWLMGSRVQSVSAQIGAHFHNQKADDAALLFLRFANSTSATLSNIGYATGGPTFLLEITCTRGRLRVDPVSGLSVGRDNAWQVVPDSLVKSWPLEPLVAEWKALLKAIQTGSEPEVGSDHARHVMEVIFAAEQSSQEKREVHVG